MLEFAVAVAAIGILSGILLNRLHYYQELAEKADMEYTIGAIKSALSLRMATMLVDGRAQEFNLLAQENPMDWLEETPRHYRGRIANNIGGQTSAGGWYFDSDTRSLVYVVENGDHFQPNSDGRKRVRLRVISLRNQPSPTLDDGAAQATDSVALSLIEPYKWF